MICGIWGEDKSAKTTLALTFPKPLVFMEFDIGGFHRAIYRFQKDFDSGLIRYEAYPLPMTFGRFDPSSLTMKPSKMVVGMKELFYEFATNYIKHLQDKDLATIVIDTATILKTVTDDCYLQELQEKQLPLDPITGLGSDKKQLRSSLIQIEYKEPNNRTRGIYYNAKSHGKNLVLVHHARDEYKPQLQRDGTIANSPTGKRERSGFTTLGDSADVIVHTYWDDKAMKPYAKVELAEVKELEGMVFEAPTFEKLDKTIKMLKGL